MKLEVGMYVRTDKGRIIKIEKIHKYEHDTILVNINGYLVNTLDITKASHNIIDLIEVGDYVNGCYVSNKRASANEHLGGNPKQIGIIKCNAYFNQGNYDDCNFKWIEAKDIKSIVTKQQFENMQYRIGE